MRFDDENMNMLRGSIRNHEKRIIELKQKIVKRFNSLIMQELGLKEKNILQIRACYDAKLFVFTTDEGLKLQFGSEYSIDTYFVNKFPNDIVFVSYFPKDFTKADEFVDWDKPNHIRVYMRRQDNIPEIKTYYL